MLLVSDVSVSALGFGAAAMKQNPPNQLWSFCSSAADGCGKSDPRPRVLNHRYASACYDGLSRDIVRVGGS
jgi:hypothetical protein